MAKYYELPAYPGITEKVIESSEVEEGRKERSPGSMRRKGRAIVPESRGGTCGYRKRAETVKISIESGTELEEVGLDLEEDAHVPEQDCPIEYHDT